MATLGNPEAPKPNVRIPISHRSCDQCRTRKIGCDRGSPCSNCLSARLDCTHSTTVSRVRSPKQRVLISATYEQKIDDIARNVNDIKKSLQHIGVTRDAPSASPSGFPPRNRNDTQLPPVTYNPPAINTSASQWAYSTYIVEFIKALTKDESHNFSESTSLGSEIHQIQLSLENLIGALEDANYGTEIQPPLARSQARVSMPSLEDAVEILRWAKQHASNTRVAWVCQILPLDSYMDICRKVYFAVEDYSDVDFIIANSFFSSVFAEYAILYGDEQSSKNCQLCRSNLDVLLTRLPLLLSPSTETIAALALGCLHYIEETKASRAWALISTALNLCQTLGYHRLGQTRGSRGTPRESQERLFWTVFTFENGLSLRLGRSSGIRDADISMPLNPHEHRATKVARIQRKAYDQLYSPSGLSIPAEERGNIAQILASQLQEIIAETHAEVSRVTSQPASLGKDPMKLVYLQCDLVCQSSILTLILKAITSSRGYERCVEVARQVFDMHDQCMKLMRDCKDPLLLSKYVNWSILHTPFVPFSILFTHAVQELDVDDLERLNIFASSFKHGTRINEPITHPYRLYELLSKAARLHFDLAKASKESSNLQKNGNSLSEPLMDQIGFELGEHAMGMDNEAMLDLGDWYYGNQQLMGLLDDDFTF